VPTCPDSDQPVAEVSPDGVDLGLIRWMLSLTSTERLEALQDFVDGALALRDGREAED
jgi:hypothetical protein